MTNDDPDDETLHEVEITFNPRPDVLEGLGITIDDFEEALINALEDREDATTDDGLDEFELPPLEEMVLEIGGVPYKLEDLAEVEIKEEGV